VTAFPPALDDGAADHLTQGLALPPISLPATDGCNECLATLPGRSVVAVYPWTGRPGQPNPADWDTIPGAHGSTPELEGLRDRSQRFAQQETRIFGLSRQTTDYQHELAARLGLPFPILSDAEGRFADALRLPRFVTGSHIYLKKLTLIVADGRISQVFYPVPDPAGHAVEILTWLKRQG